MHVAVENDSAIDPPLGLHRANCDHSVVEDTVALPMVTKGVVGPSGQVDSQAILKSSAACGDRPPNRASRAVDKL
jgi:hypothetical protein